MEERKLAEEPPAGAGASLFTLPLTIAALGLVAFAAAANGAAGLAAAAAMALALMAAARLWGRLGLAGLKVALSCGQTRLFPGEPLTLSADINNRKILPVWIGIEIDHSAALAPENDKGVRGDIGVRPFGRVAGAWEFRASRRGIHRLGPAEIRAGDIFGLNAREKSFPCSREILVFPRPAPLRPFDIPFRDNFGIHPSKGVIEDPAWYEGTREYQGARPAKNIHWKASARLSVPQEKIFAPTSHQKVFLILDGKGFLEAPDPEGLESALEVLAALARRFSETGDSFALATDLRVRDFSQAIPPGRGPEHLGVALELMARCEPEEGQTLGPLLGGFASSGAGFVVASHSPARETASRLLNLAPARRSRALFLFRRRDDAPMEHPFLFFDDILAGADG